MPKADCNECQGDGGCIFCESTGVMDNERDDECDVCDGTGKCQACKDPNEDDEEEDDE